MFCALNYWSHFAFSLIEQSLAHLSWFRFATPRRVKRVVLFTLFPLRDHLSVPFFCSPRQTALLELLAATTRARFISSRLVLITHAYSFLYQS